MNTNESDKQKESLALEVACGRSLRLWAKRNGVDVQVAYGWSLTNAFRALVHVARLRVADRIVGTLLRSAQRAIKQLVRLCTEGESDAIQLSASSKLVDFWLVVSKEFHLEDRMQAMEELASTKDERFRSGDWQPLPRWAATTT
jgi:hypothetical protein